MYDAAPPTLNSLWMVANVTLIALVVDYIAGKWIAASVTLVLIWLYWCALFRPFTWMQPPKSWRDS